jgi:hypothetical protein
MNKMCIVQLSDDERSMCQDIVKRLEGSSICAETVRKTIKNGMTKRKIEYWVIPPDQDAEFVADMENVLET